MIHKISLGGRDFQIMETSPFSSEWFSHKHKRLRVRYEIAVSTVTGHIFWVFGPFPCGSFNDFRSFRIRLKTMLFPEERVIADRGI